MSNKDIFKMAVAVIFAAIVGTVIGCVAFDSIPETVEEPKADPLAQPIVYQTDETFDAGVIYEDLIVLEEVPEENVDELIARVVEAESGIEPFIGKVAVATVILNRMEARGMSAEAVIYEKNQFASPAGKASEESLRAVAFAKEARDLFPKNMTLFRNQHYHTYGKEYIQIGRHYFSVDPTLEADK